MAILGGIAVLSGCKPPAATGEAPPRATDKFEAPHEASTISVPLDADISLITRALEQEVPRELWSIDKHIDRCVAPQRVKLFGARIPVTPKLACDVEGQVTRGTIRLHGEGQDIVADLPIHAVIRVRKVAGILHETATGNAMAQARIRLNIDGNWNPGARITLRYGWSKPPGIDFLGQRITFTDKADERLQPVVRNLERTLPGELRKLELRRKVEGAWRQAFTTLQLNGSNPPVWMRITPQKLGYGGYEIAGSTLRLRLGLEAVTETFVGDKPAPATPTPLPGMGRVAANGALRFSIPVIADYAELQPVLARALKKREQRPFDLPGLGPVNVRFDQVEIYGTNGGRIALGLTLSATTARTSTETKGRVWLTALPVNVANTRQVGFQDLKVTGKTDRMGGDLLLQIANSPGLSQALAEALEQNFSKDFAGLMGKIDRAIVENREGDFIIHARLDKVDTGSLMASGQGLYLPVWASGQARVNYRPR